MRSRLQKIGLVGASLTTFVLLWALLANHLNDNALPPPIDVWNSLLVEYRSGELFHHLGMTLLRVLAAFIVAMAVGYIWFGLNEAAAVGAVALNKIPNVVITLREGARSLNPEYSEMAQVYRFGFIKRLRHVVIPQLQPFFAAATRSGISLIWKIVLIVELLGRSNGVGFQIHLYFQLFDVATILAYTLAFVAVMLFVEYCLLQPLDKHSNRWRASHE